MTDREQDIVGFLHDAGWADAKTQPLAGDLSARKYSRLTRPNGTRAIFMDANPAVDRSTAAYVAMANWLTACGLSAPRLLAAQKSNGLLLLEDFGDEKLTGLVQLCPEQQGDYYRLAIEVLLVIRDAPPPDLMRPSARQMADATALADDWYPGANLAALAQLRVVLEVALKELLETAPTVSLRDFHTDNLMWLNNLQGARRLGLLDFQDAILTHPVYDLMSLLTDARVSVPRALRSELIEHYAAKSGDTVESVTLAVAVLGAQRNLRILGIFTRAATRFGKTQHLSSLARVYEYLSECLSHPVFLESCPVLPEMIPEPNAELLSGLRK